MRKVLTEGDCDDFTIDDVLAKANVTQSEYKEALAVSANGFVIVLKRKPNECNVNNYNPHVLRAWQANMDIQYVLNGYACVMYIASYIMKTDRAMGELLKRVANETRTEDLKTQLKKVANMDIQYVLNGYACVMYIASYIMKTDRAMGELLKRVANETRTEDLKTLRPNKKK